MNTGSASSPKNTGRSRTLSIEGGSQGANFTAGAREFFANRPREAGDSVLVKTEERSRKSDVRGQRLRKEVTACQKSGVTSKHLTFADRLRLDSASQACESEAMTLPDIRIDYLADHPELLDDLAWLSWKEWQEIYEQREQTLEHCLKNYRERMNTDRLPLTLVAVRGRLAVNSPELLGMVSLKFHDMDTRPDLDPWLGGLLVLPEWRSRGVGTMLMHRATEEARRLNVSQLYLWTHSAERLYQKLDWQVVERTNYFGKEAVVMERNLQ